MYRCISEFDLDTTDLTGESDEKEDDNEEEEDEDEDEDEDRDEGEDKGKDTNSVPLDACILSAASKPSQRALGKRRKRVDSYEDDETEPELPPLPQDKEGYSQMRTSGRARKRARNLDDYDVTYE
ncbi:hypothetical protein BDV33DRAFT_210973 [Aspergillus novoparasiticus]|uniref:Uncharacterized protein n=1 Tax=Aspergillus novoparasiticus TaxID=986946 RepID=A0A5N6E643_9EURO|nr:hypothetical protein BDV33DRAFT_210973 [Aspergillus novoparasiticus]